MRFKVNAPRARYVFNKYKKGGKMKIQVKIKLLFNHVLFQFIVHSCCTLVMAKPIYFTNDIPLSVFTVSQNDTFQLTPITFTSNGSKLQGYISTAPGKGPHPTIVLLHGSPGGPRDVLGLAKVIPNAGWNALAFTFRGYWNSEGTYSMKNTLEDVFAALNFLRSNEVLRKYKIDVDNLALAGYSYGGGMALIAAANESTIRYVISIAAADMSEIARQLRKSREFREMISAELDKDFEGPIKGPGGEKAIEEALRDSDKYDLVKHAQDLSEKELLIISGWRDQQTTLEGHALPIIRALQSIGSEDITKVILETDHSFSGKKDELRNIIISWLKNRQLR